MDLDTDLETLAQRGASGLVAASDMIEDAGRIGRAVSDRLTGGVFMGLAEIVYSSDSFDSVFDSLCTAATRLVDGCDHASLMVRRNTGIETAACSDDVARLVDRFERELNDGPCVDAIVDEAYQLDPDITRGCRWPSLAERVVEETPVRGMAGFRMLVDGDKVGALNVFSDTPAALTVTSADQATILAAFSSVALAAVEHKEQAASLRAGLESNREIGQAVGLLMAAHHVDDREAFALLRKASQDLNVKLADVAREFVGYRNQR